MTDGDKGRNLSAVPWTDSALWGGGVVQVPLVGGTQTPRRRQQISCGGRVALAVCASVLWVCMSLVFHFPSHSPSRSLHSSLVSIPSVGTGPQNLRASSLTRGRRLLFVLRQGFKLLRLASNSLYMGGKRSILLPLWSLWSSMDPDPRSVPFHRHSVSTIP